MDIGKIRKREAAKDEHIRGVKARKFTGEKSEDKAEVGEKPYSRAVLGIPPVHGLGGLIAPRDAESNTPVSLANREHPALFRVG